MGRTLVVCVIATGLCWFSVPPSSSAQPPAKPPPLERPTIITRYQIEASLDAEHKRIAGRERLVWLNDSNDDIRELQFHLYLNAFKNSDTTFMSESKAQRRGFGQGINAFDFKHWGHIDVTSVRTAQGEDLTGRLEFIQPDDGNPYDETVLRVPLPAPVPPRGHIDLFMEFVAQLPQVFARTGFRRDFFLVVQWFPKIGVYEEAGERGRPTGGWNCHQFHATSEFYADYGVYDVTLTVPSTFVVGATGGVPRRRQDNGNGTTTYNFYQEDVHDFGWTAGPDYVRVERPFLARRQVSEQELTDMVRILGLPREQVQLSDVNVILLTQPDHREQIDRHFRAVFQAIKYFGLWYGRYPYSTLTVVDPPRGADAAGGMEYPTFITAGTEWWAPGRVLSPEGVTIHEFGHQFWYGLVANNEFEEAWLDEGINSYSTSRVLETAYGPNHSYERFFGIPIPGQRWLEVRLPYFPFAAVDPVPLGSYLQQHPHHEWQRRWSRYIVNAEFDVMRRSAWEYLHANSYRTNAYDKPMLMLHTLENYLGRELMARVMRTFHQRYRFRHPTSQDFITTVNEVTGLDLRGYFNQVLYGSGVVDYAVTELTSGPVEDRQGVYDQGGRRVTIEKPERSESPKLYETVVVVQRLGEVAFPAKVEVVFENGHRQHEHWDGAYRWRRWRYLKPERAVSATVASGTLDPSGPNRPVFLDVDLINNSRTRKANHLPAERWSAKLMFWIQNLLHTLSTLS
jgi:hypothetical protein